MSSEDAFAHAGAPDAPTDASATAGRPGGPLVTRLGLAAFAVAALTLVLDQLSKAWVLKGLGLQVGQSIRLLPVFSLTGVRNTGVSFGLMRASGLPGRLMLAAFAAVVVIGLALWARRVRRPLVAVGLGMVMGGALGNNLVDRLRFGAVTDFLDFSGLYFPWVFNVADSAICVGVALLLLDGALPARPSGGTALRP